MTRSGYLKCDRPGFFFRTILTAQTDVFPGHRPGEFLDAGRDRFPDVGIELPFRKAAGRPGHPQRLGLCRASNSAERHDEKNQCRQDFLHNLAHVVQGRDPTSPAWLALPTKIVLFAGTRNKTVSGPLSVVMRIDNVLVLHRIALDQTLCKQACNQAVCGRRLSMRAEPSLRASCRPFTLRSFILDWSLSALPSCRGRTRRIK
jgi:hypothetical protein